MPVSVDVYSDAICPWCFVGKRRLERAIRELGQRAEVTVAWRPFELNPDMPPEGLDRRAYRSAKFGSWARSQALDAQVAVVGAAEGISFAHGRIARTPNTLDAHRLIRLAGARGRQDAVVEALFRAYFVDGLDVGDRPTLAGIAAAAGFDAGEVARLLAGDGGVAEVRAEEDRARGLGVTGVPFVVVDGAFAVSGAQPAEVFLAALTKAVDLATDDRPASAAPAEDAAPACPIGTPRAC